MKDLILGLQYQNSFHYEECLVGIWMSMPRIASRHDTDSNHVIVDCGDGFVEVTALDRIRLFVNINLAYVIHPVT